METKIYRTTMKAARSMQIVKEDPSLHPSWLDEEAMGARMTKGSEPSSKDSLDILPSSPPTES